MTLVISKGLTLDNGTRAAAIAGVSPTLDYRFAREKREIETVSLTDKLTYTGGNGTFTGSDGFIQPATTNVPRFDHDPVSRQSLGLLSEASRTNLIQRSAQFENVYWTKNGATITANFTTAPDGSSAGARLECTSTASFQGRITITPPGEQITCVSIFAKKDSTDWLHITLSGTNSLARRCWFNLDAGTIGGTAVGSQGGGTLLAQSIQAVSGGFYRCAVAADAGQSQSWSAGSTLYQAADANLSTNGTAGNSILIWGAQVETASTPSTYIPTTSAAVTRTADSAVIDGTGVLTGTYTMVEKPAGCAVVSGTNINLQPGFTAERVMVFPAALDAGQITAIRGAM
jgi:hypothetical protein